MRRIATAVLLVVAAAGCVRGGAADNPFQGGVDGERTIRIEVRNFNFADATVFAFRGTERVRLGRVTGKTDEDFRVAWTLTQPLRVQIDLLAGGRCTTRPMNMSPGDVVEIQIPIDLGSDPDCR